MSYKFARQTGRPCDTILRMESSVPWLRSWLGLGMVLVGALVQASETWTPELQLQVQSFGEVAASPNGQRAAWTEVSAGSARLLIDRQPVPDWTANASGLTWSPRGDFLYFHAGPAAYRVNTTDPAHPGPPERVSRHPGASGGFRLSPDGAWLAFLERTDKFPKSKVRLAGVPAYSQRICVAPSDGKSEARCPITPPGFASAIDWSPDSKHLAFELRPTPFADDARSADLYEADIQSGSITPFARSNATETKPRYSPDGRHIAFLRSDDPPLQAGDERIVLWDREKKSARELAATDDRLPELLGWSGDSKRVFYSEARGTRNVLFAMPLDGPPALAFAPNGVAQAASVNAAGTHLAFSLESPGAAPEAHILKPGGGPPVKVSAANTRFESMDTARTEVVWWRSKGNLEVEGLLTFPNGYEQGKKYPMVTILHGGPYGHFDESFIGRGGLYPVATFAAQGYAVFRPNPRASTGYGRDFRYLNLKDWGGGDFEDVVSGVRAQALADPSRLAVMGWSYGGFLTSWTISHSNLFQAACIGAGVSNLWSQTGTSDIRSNKIEAFGAPWENQAFYIERSPLTHVANVKIPVLILGGEADERVPISQSYELFHALKRRKIETELAVYPGAGHSPRDPEQVLDIMKRHLGWVARFVGKRQD